MDEFESVANGSRQRARWRGAAGWVRLTRVSDQRLCLRGPRKDVLRVGAARPGWDCLYQRAIDAGGTIELMLVRAEAQPGCGVLPRFGHAPATVQLASR